LFSDLKLFNYLCIKIKQNKVIYEYFHLIEGKE